MHGPATVGWLLVALCTLTGICCLLRAKGTDGARRENAGGEALMGFGMAAMAVPSVGTWQPLPPAVTAAAFAVLFAALLARELRLPRRRRGEEHAGACGSLHHTLGAVAMLYMSLTMLASSTGAGAGAGAGTAMGGGMAHGSGGGVPVLTGALLVYFAGAVLWNGTRLIPSPGGGAAVTWSGGATAGPQQGAVQQPGVAAGCRLAMGTAMFAMLLTL